MKKSAWRFFPLAVAIFLLSVVAIDGGMIWAALHSFPGSVDDHAFAIGNHYNEILKTADREAALGWTLDVKVVSGDIEVTLTDRNGQILSGAAIEAVATHPVGPAETTRVSFAPRGAAYVAEPMLLKGSQWDLGFTASIGEAEYHVTRRIVIQ